MKRIFFLITLVSLGLFSSCDKCKDTTCVNGSTCDKKTAECSNVCQNGGDNIGNGSCSCVLGYSGDKCETVVRENYLKTYSGTSQYLIEGESQVLEEEDALTLELLGNDAKTLKIKGTNLTVTLENNNNYFRITGSYEVDGITLSFDSPGGIGNIKEDSFGFKGSISGNYQGKKIKGFVTFISKTVK